MSLACRMQTSLVSTRSFSSKPDGDDFNNVIQRTVAEEGTKQTYNDIKDR